MQTNASPEHAVFTPGRVNVIDLALLLEDLPWGQLSPVAGHAGYEYIQVASEHGRSVHAALGRTVFERSLCPPVSDFPEGIHGGPGSVSETSKSSGNSDDS